MDPLTSQTFMCEPLWQLIAGNCIKELFSSKYITVVAAYFVQTDYSEKLPIKMDATFS